MTTQYFGNCISQNKATLAVMWQLQYRGSEKGGGTFLGSIFENNG
jgi:hypothetical protein